MNSLGAGTVRVLLVYGAVVGCARAPEPPAESPAQPVDDRSLNVLVFVGGHIHDGRIYDAARAAAADPTRPRRERVAALFTLVSHYNPYLSAAAQDPYPGVARGQIAIGQSAHLLLSHGAVPLPPDAGAAIAGLYAQLARTDPDPDLQYIAGELQQGLGRYVAGEEHPFARESP